MHITPRLKAVPMVVFLFSLSLLVEKELKATRVSIVNKPLWYSTFGFVLHEEMGLLPKALLKKKFNNNVKLLNSKRLLEVIFYPFFILLTIFHVHRAFLIIHFIIITNINLLICGVFQVDDNIVNKRVVTSMHKRYSTSVKNSTKAIAAAKNTENKCKAKPGIDGHLDAWRKSYHSTEVLKFLSWKHCCGTHEFL